MVKKRTVTIVAIALVAAIVLAIACSIPFLLPHRTGETGEKEASYEFEAPALTSEVLYPKSHDGTNYYVSADGKDIDHADGSIDNPYNIDAIRWFTRD